MSKIINMYLAVLFSMLLFQGTAIANQQQNVAKLKKTLANTIIKLESMSDDEFNIALTQASHIVDDENKKAAILAMINTNNARTHVISRMNNLLENESTNGFFFLMDWLMGFPILDDLSDGVAPTVFYIVATVVTLDGAPGSLLLAQSHF